MVILHQTNLEVVLGGICKLKDTFLIPLGMNQHQKPPLGISGVGWQYHSASDEME